MKKYFISYGDHKYASQREYLRQTAIYSGYFDEVQIFSRENIGHEFSDQVYNVLRQPRGGGYWIWKPYFVKKVLDSLEENDILIYCDAGCLVNPAARERFDQYVKMLKESKTGTIDFELPHIEYTYTKREVFDHLNSSKDITDTNQLMATVLLFRKCVHSTMLVDKWYDHAWNYSSLFSDERWTDQHPLFIDHRHDQSMFSVIRKTYGANKIPDETYFLDFVKEGQKSPFWAVHIKG